MTIYFLSDTVTLDSKAFRRREDGYLVAEPRIARVGVQDYLGRELGRPDLGRVRVLRPPEEVFAPDTLKSFAHRPVTRGHPPVPVTSKNYKQYARGHTTGEIARDGEFIRVPLMVADEDTIAAIEDGEETEISAGYGTVIDWTPGVHDEYGEYDAVQRQIRDNHVAIVKKARGGEKLRVGDEAVCPECGAPMSGMKCQKCGYTKDEMFNTEGDKAMAKQFTVDAVTVEATDTSAQVIIRALETRDAKIKELEGRVTANDTALATAQTEVVTLKKTIETKDAEIATHKKVAEDAKPTAALLDQLATERQVVVDKATAILKDKLVVKDQTTQQIRRQVVDAAMGDTAKGWSDESVTSAFAVIASSVGDSKGTATHVPGVTDLAASFAGGRPGYTVQTAQETQKIMDAAYKGYEAELTKGRAA